MRISIIAAVAENGVIGRNGQLPWRLSDDLRRFKRLTLGHTIVMGRRTWESIGRALPGRQSVVVSRRADYQTGMSGVATAKSLDAALELAATKQAEEAFVIGGAELFQEALSRADRLYMTWVRAAVEGDTFFPEVEWGAWQLLESEEHDPSEKNEFGYCFEIYERRQSAM